MIRALIFDFDGLILETEEPIFLSWQAVYGEYGCHLPYETWAAIIGTSDFEFEPLAELERQYGSQVNRVQVAGRQRELEMELILQKEPLPGVESYLVDALKMGLKIGLASSSTCEWVTGHLDRLGLLKYFDTIYGSDDVDRTKPDPALFLAVLADLGVEPGEAIVFEDSPHGVRAAKHAGIFCVAVPNDMTRGLPLDHADLHLDSMTALPLGELLRLVSERI